MMTKAEHSDHTHHGEHHHHGGHHHHGDYHQHYGNAHDGHHGKQADAVGQHEKSNWGGDAVRTSTFIYKRDYVFEVIDLGQLTISLSTFMWPF